MSEFDLHMILQYDPNFKLLTAEIINKNENPINWIDVEYKFFFDHNDIPFRIINGSSKVSTIITTSNIFNYYKVVACYNKDDSTKTSFSSIIIIGQKYIMKNDNLIQTNNDDSVLISIVPSQSNQNFLYENVICTYNRKKIFSSKTLENLILNVEYNGIYEISFTDILNDFTYFSAIEITDAKPTMYYKFVDEDNFLYGPAGLSMLIC